MEYVGAGGGTSRSILEQAQDYVNVLVPYRRWREGGGGGG
uniref:Uncharacterized protein n=1 Tax=Ascaris lumbricoides TaxID=6252 RepID=A0A0M3HHI5_ASCLU